jgi:2'-5' RNA ligase
MVRLFVAVYPPPYALDDLAAFVATLGVGQAAAAGVNARLAARPLWHITLAFLGDVSESKVGDVRRAITRAAERTGGAGPALRFAGGGRFGRGHFTVVWAGLGGDVAYLSRIAGEVRRQLDGARVRYDTKPFRPHLTLARPGARLPAETVTADVAALSEYRGPQWTADTLALVASHLGPRPTHETLHEARVGGV